MYETKIVGIIATNDLPIYAEHSFSCGFIDDDNLESLLDALASHDVINYKADFEVEDDQESVEELSVALPPDHYFIAIETPIRHLWNGKLPCFSWGYTQMMWVFVKDLQDIDRYRQEVGRLADETLQETDDDD